MANTSIINIDKFYEYAGEEDNMRNAMVALFQEQCLAYFEELSLSAEKQANNEWRDVAHKFKGMASFAGATSLFLTCKEAQDMADAPMNIKTSLLQRIEAESQLAAKILQSHVKNEVNHGVSS